MGEYSDETFHLETHYSERDGVSFYKATSFVSLRGVCEPHIRAMPGMFLMLLELFNCISLA